MGRRPRAILGFLVASLIPALIFAAANPLTDKGDVVSFLGWVSIFYVYSFLATLFLGVPTFLILLRFKLIRWWSALGAGAAIGALVAILVQSNSAHVHDLGLAVVTGIASGFGFWLVWRQGAESHASRSAVR